MATIAGGSGTAAGGVTEKVTECLIRGVVEKNILNELIPVLQVRRSVNRSLDSFLVLLFTSFKMSLFYDKR